MVITTNISLHGPAGRKVSKEEEGKGKSRRFAAKSSLVGKVDKNAGARVS